LGSPWLHSLRQLEHVSATDMAFVGPRMHGNAVSPRLMRKLGEAQHIRDSGTARIAQQCDFVQIDA
jgi:hypothetical protein